VYLGRRWSALNWRQRFDRARMLSSGLFVLGVVVLLATGKEAVDEMYEYGASPVLVAEAWRYAAQNFLVSVGAAAILWIAPRIVDRTTR
jgi:K+ transporter